MPALSFRVKILLAMMGVVIGVTGATLYISLRRNQADYRTHNDELFHLQSAFFTADQKRVFDALGQYAQKLAPKTRVLNALREVSSADDAESIKTLYDRAKSDLQTFGLVPQPGEASRPNDLSLYVFLDAKGRPLTEGAGAGPLPSGRQDQLIRQLALVGQAMIGREKPVSTYLTSVNEQGETELHQAVFAKLLDDDSEPLGLLGLAFLMRQPDVQSGVPTKPAVFFEGNLFSEAMTPPQRTALAARLASEIKRPTNSLSEDFVETLEGEPYRVLHQALTEDEKLPTAYLVSLISLREALEAARSLRSMFLLLGILGIAAALTISLLVSRSMSGPVLELVRGTAAIQEGNFDYRVSVRSRDEIGRLAKSFNEMAGGLAQREKFRGILDMVADKEVAQELIDGSVALGGETRQVSVLFCDIRGFTPLTQGMNPEEVIRMLNEHFTPLTRLVNEHHGVVDKFVGDLIMALFGAPKSYGDDAFNATACARAMIRERAKLNAVSKYHIEVGIGVASGPVLAGRMGSENRLNYTVLGERVNLASRLCSKAGRMDVVIDQTTLDQLKGRIPTAPLGEIELKGFSSRVQAYKLLDVIPKEAKA